jgi:hypothetical protein
MLSSRNVTAGYVEPAHINDFQFDNQRKTFTSYGKIVRKFNFVLMSYCRVCRPENLLPDGIFVYKVFP